MSHEIDRRMVLGAAGAAVVTGVLGRGSLAQAPATPQKVIAVNTSLRAGKTTAAGLTLCLEAAKEMNPALETELIELAGLSLPGGPAAGVPLGPEERDDFPRVMAALTDQRTAGIIVATPVYYSGLTFLCKAFLDRLGACRRDNFALADKVGGVLAVGVVRNGGQELAIQAVQNALLCQEMIIVGDGRPTAHTGATLLNPGTDDIAGDEFGLATARNLGRRVAQVALRLARTTKG